MPEIQRTSLASRAAASLLLTIFLPLLGAWWAGDDLTNFLVFPPEGQRRAYPGFSWAAFAGLWTVFAALVTAWFWARPGETPDGEATPQSGAGYAFPRWGWAGLALTAASWWMAWSPDAWPWFRRYSFPPLWLGFIIVVNAWIQQRTGACPLTRAPRFFLALFPASAAFWWLFEYLNRFVNNWVYVNPANPGPVDYVVHATLAFSTVLPAVYSVRLLLGTWPWLQAQLARGPRLPAETPRPAGAAVLAASAGGMVGIGFAPNLLFPLLWVGLLGLWVSIGVLQTGRHPWPELSRGDWRDTLSWAIAALICGFFWEMWNVYSMPKWEYQIPYFERFYCFEMPVSGYLGYLPFGLECALAVYLIQIAFNGLSRPESSRVRS